MDSFKNWRLDLWHRWEDMPSVGPSEEMHEIVFKNETVNYSVFLSSFELL